MKRIILSLVAFLGVLSYSQAQNGGAFEKGDLLINAGIGVGTYYGYSSSVAVGGSIEYGVSNFISVGGQLDIYSSKFSNYRWTYVPIAARGSYHFGKHFLKIDNLDLYGGAALGYYITFDDRDNNFVGDANSGKVFVDLFAGARYYIKPKFGFFGEVGAGVSALKLGVTFKL